ncbi:MAG TPA: hypothetical protein VF783_05080, partial [Terriglobales bacterium]
MHYRVHSTKVKATNKWYADPQSRDDVKSHLMRCSDGNFYVVKFQNNPQQTRVLANDCLGTWQRGSAYWFRREPLS